MHRLHYEQHMCTPVAQFYYILALLNMVLLNKKQHRRVLWQRLNIDLTKLTEESVNAGWGGWSDESATSANVKPSTSSGTAASIGKHWWMPQDWLIVREAMSRQLALLIYPFLFTGIHRRMRCESEPEILRQFFEEEFANPNIHISVAHSRDCKALLATKGFMVCSFIRQILK